MDQRLKQAEDLIMADNAAEIARLNFEIACTAEENKLVGKISDPRQRKQTAMAKAITARPDLHAEYLTKFNEQQRRKSGRRP